MVIRMQTKLRTEQKFFICKHCGNIVGLVVSGGAPLTCCGDQMEELKQNTSEASAKSHMPVIQIENDKVTVSIGDVAHPMKPEHFVAWIYLETENGGQRKAISLDQAPQAVFTLYEDKALAAFAYCNQHGLWKTVVE